MMDAPEDILAFWFPPTDWGEQAAAVRQVEWWFRGGANADINRRFRPLLERAIRGELDTWADNARGRLALIIVLDQFSRGVFAGTAQAFAQDPKALDLAIEGLENGHYEQLPHSWEKTFFVLPLGHSEVLAQLERVVVLTQQILDTAPPSERAILTHSAAQARGHRDVVARFGRHPHRNAVLGRPSTPEELEYLANGDLVHTRSVKVTSPERNS
jgi:uncharacterized protein (DUF924 family)